MPATQCPYVGESKEVVRKQEVPALSSAEAEIISIVETAKEMVSIGMLLQTVIQGILSIL